MFIKYKIYYVLFFKYVLYNILNCPPGRLHCAQKSMKTVVDDK